MDACDLFVVCHLFRSSVAGAVAAFVFSMMHVLVAVLPVVVVLLQLLLWQCLLSFRCHSFVVSHLLSNLAMVHLSLMKRIFFIEFNQINELKEKEYGLTIFLRGEGLRETNHF